MILLFINTLCRKQEDIEYVELEVNQLPYRLKDYAKNYAKKEKHFKGTMKLTRVLVAETETGNVEGMFPAKDYDIYFEVNGTYQVRVQLMEFKKDEEWKIIPLSADYDGPEDEKKQKEKDDV